MRHLIYIIGAVLALASCGQTAEQDELRQLAEQRRLAREDSAALKIAVTPTLDCLPAFVAEELGLTDTLGSGVRLKAFASQIDCDTAIVKGHVEGAFSDIVRAQMMVRKGARLDFIAATEAHWKLLAGRNQRINGLRQLDEKIVGIARHSASDALIDHVADSIGLSAERLYRVQVNDIALRLHMITVKTIDAAILPEPHAAAARLDGHRVLMSSEGNDLATGVLVFRADATADKNRKAQIDRFIKAYNTACDTINSLGIGAFRQLIARRCGVSEAAVDSISTKIKFAHATAPSAEKMAAANRWLDNAERWMDD